jgi:hypothetical protein
MACGCVPVISDECGSAAFISAPEAGLVFRAGDVAELRSALQRLLDDPASIGGIGRTAMLSVRAELAPAVFVRRFEAMAAGGRPPRIDAPGSRPDRLFVRPAGARIFHPGGAAGTGQAPGPPPR